MLASNLLSRLPLRLSERVRVVRDTTIPPTGRWVLYWLHHAMRGHENPALDVAIAISEQLDLPLLVYQGLSETYPYASDRHHTFILQGMRDLQMVDLNHHYALDGRDPCSYGGLLWCLGLFDRPFPPARPIYGTIRERSSREHARRLDHEHANRTADALRRPVALVRRLRAGVGALRRGDRCRAPTPGRRAVTGGSGPGHPSGIGPHRAVLGGAGPVPYPIGTRL